MMEFFLRNNRLSPFRMSSTESQAVGWHDGIAATLHGESLNDEVVYHHEFGHEKLFTGSIDGSILATLWTVLDNPQTDDKCRLSSIEVTSRTLMDFSQKAHEIFATYYGIKMVDPSQEQEAISRLDIEYKNYFQQAADVLDRYFHSSFLQVCVANALSQCAFSSNFALRFFDDPWKEWRGLSPDEAPNCRLQSILDFVASGNGNSLRQKLENCAKIFFGQEHITPWDLDEEDAWTRDHLVAFKLDLTLGDAARIWMMDQNVVPMISNEMNEECSKKLGVVATQLGLKFQSFSKNAFSLDSFDVAKRLSSSNIMEVPIAFVSQIEAHAHKQASSKITNSTTIKSVPFFNGPVKWEVDEFARADELLVVVGESDEDSQIGVIMRFGPEDSTTNFQATYSRRCYAERYRPPEIIKWLNSKADTLLSLWGNESRLVIVLPAGSRDKTDKYISMDAVFEEGCLDPRLNHRVVNYFTGSWLHVIENGKKYGGIDLTQLHITVVDPNGKDQPMRLHIAGSNYPGHSLIRILSPVASTLISSLIKVKYCDDSCRVLSSKEAREAGIDLGLIEKAFEGVLICWSRF